MLAAPGEPQRGSPLELLEAWRRSGDIRTAWRARYHMPPTDPRFLEADDETILQDLIVMRYHDLRQAMAGDARVRAEQLASDPERLASLAKFGKRIAGRLTQSVRRFVAGTRTDEPAPVKQRAKIALKGGPV